MWAVVGWYEGTNVSELREDESYALHAAASYVSNPTIEQVLLLDKETRTGQIWQRGEDGVSHRTLFFNLGGPIKVRRGYSHTETEV